jgi:hypothetical protein
VPPFDLLHYSLVLVVGVLSVARTVRLIIYDEFPPMEWLRARLLALFPEDSKWKAILTCPFCLAPYVTAAMIAWAYFSDLHWSWWLLNIWWAASYVAAIVVAYDEAAE